MHAIWTATRDPFFSAYDGTVSGAQADGKWCDFVFQQILYIINTRLRREPIWNGILFRCHTYIRYLYFAPKVYSYETWKQTVCTVTTVFLRVIATNISLRHYITHCQQFSFFALWWSSSNSQSLGAPVAKIGNVNSAVLWNFFAVNHMMEGVTFKNNPFFLNPKQLQAHLLRLLSLYEIGERNLLLLKLWNDINRNYFS